MRSPRSSRWPLSACGERSHHPASGRTARQHPRGGRRSSRATSIAPLHYRGPDSQSENPVGAFLLMAAVALGAWLFLVMFSPAVSS